MKFLITFLIVVCLLNKVEAREIPTIHFTIENGLPSNRVYDIFRDDDGFLWFATNKGISIFNGITFKNYSTANGLADNTIYFFQKDNFGRIWLGTENGELCYFKNGRFFNKKNKAFLNIPNDDRITEYITLEKDSSVTIYFSDRTKLINILGERVKVISIKKLSKEFKGFNVKHISKIHSNCYELLYEDKAAYIDSFGNKIKSYTFPSKILYHKSRDQEFFIYSNAIWDRKKKLFSLPKLLENLNANAFYRIYSDAQNNFIGTSAGFFVNGDRMFLENERVSSIAKDIDSNYLIATLDNGVYFIGKNIHKTSSYILKTNSQIIQSKSIQNKVFLISLDKQIFSIENKTEPRKLYDFLGDYNLKYQHLNPATFLSDSVIYLIFGMNVYQKRINGKLEAKKCNIYNPKKLFYFNQHYFVQGGTEIFYHCANFFANKSDSINFKYFLNETKNSNYAVEYMTQAPNGEIWFATRKSVFKINAKFHLQEQENLKRLGLQYFEVFNNNILGIDNGNQLISISNYNSPIFKADTIENTDFIWDKIYPIGPNKALVTSNKFHRLVRFDRSNNSPQFEIIENALVPKNIDHVAALGGYVFFFRNSNVTVLDTNDLTKRYVKPIVRIASIASDKIQYNPNENKLILNYNESKNLKIKFEIATVPGTEIFYEYAIENLNDNKVLLHWSALNSPEILLYRLPFGSYKLHIRGRSHSDQNSLPKFIFIKINSPLWAKWWFIVLIILSVLAIIALIVFKRVKFVLKKKEIEHRMEIRLLKTEYKSLNALINPHFIFNTLNSVQALIQKNELISSNRYMKILSNLIRQNMQNVSKELIPLKREIELIENYLELEKLRFKENLHFQFHIDDNIDLEEIFIPPLLVQPLVENAVKHGIFNKNSIDGLIKIYVEQKLNSITIKVIDNGLGFEYTSTTENGHESYGLSNIQSRLLQLNKIYDIQIQFKIEEIKDEKDQISGVCSTIIILIKD